ncbi:MAG: hypothetical protein ACO2PN_12000 [Pyrobaculum sp.]|jgi:hypothetical protein
MIDQIDLLKFAAYAVGMPPQRFGWAVYDYGGVASIPNAGWPAVVVPDIRNDLLDAVLAHARKMRNAVLVAWLYEKPLALWRLLPPPRIRRRIIIIDEWGQYRESKDKVFAVAWIKSGCCCALAWSYPYAALKARRMRYVPPVVW